MVNLKPCPKCGKKAIIEPGSMFGLYRGRCASYFCDTTGPETDNPIYAAELWNSAAEEINEKRKQIWPT